MTLFEKNSFTHISEFLLVEQYIGGLLASVKKGKNFNPKSGNFSMVVHRKKEEEKKGKREKKDEKKEKTIRGFYWSFE